MKPKEIRKIFRKRWRIETSYRMINMFLPKTTSRIYSVRKLYFYLAVLLCNIWAIINQRRNITVNSMKLIIFVEILLQDIYFIDDGG